MIDCTKMINYPHVMNVTYANYKKEDKIVYSPRVIEFVSHFATMQFGAVETDDTAVKYEHKLSNEFKLYDLVDLETGYVVARVFKTDLKKAAMFLYEQDIVHVKDGLYQSRKWTASIQSKRRYTQYESH